MYDTIRYKKCLNLCFMLWFSINKSNCSTMLHTATVRPRISGPRILYNTPLRPPQGSVKPIFPKLVNHVSSEQIHHKPIGKCYGGLLKVALLWWNCFNDTRLLGLVKRSFADPCGGLKYIYTLPRELHRVENIWISRSLTSCTSLLVLQ